MTESDNLIKQMLDIYKDITPTQYNALPEKEQDYYIVSKWSKYHTVLEDDFCLECGHSGKVKVSKPTKDAKPLKYSYAPCNMKLWAKQVNEFLKDNLISITDG